MSIFGIDEEAICCIRLASSTSFTLLAEIKKAAWCSPVWSNPTVCFSPVSRRCVLLLFHWCRRTHFWQHKMSIIPSTFDASVPKNISSSIFWVASNTAPDAVVPNLKPPKKHIHTRYATTRFVKGAWWCVIRKTTNIFWSERLRERGFFDHLGCFIRVCSRFRRTAS